MTVLDLAIRSLKLAHAKFFTSSANYMLATLFEAVRCIR